MKPGVPREHRYYKRVCGWPDTRCWGAAIVLGLALPVALLTGQSAPTIETAPYVRVWSERLMPDSDRLLWVDDLAVTAGPDTGVEARAAADGHVAWKTALEGVRAIDASAGVVFAAGGGAVHAIDPASGATRWSSATSPDAPSLAATPAFVLVADAREIRALRARDGTLAWRLPLRAAPVTRISVDEAFGVVALADHTLIAFDVASGAEHWRFELDTVALTLTASRNRVYVGTRDATICAFSQATGRVSWRYLVGIPAVGDPVTDDRHVYVAQLDNTLKRYDAGSGKLIDSEALRNRPALGPRVAGDTIAVPLATGSIGFVSRSLPSKLTRLTPDIPPRLDAVTVSADGTLLVTLGLSEGNRALTAYRRGDSGATPEPRKDP